MLSPSSLSSKRRIENRIEIEQNRTEQNRTEQNKSKVKFELPHRNNNPQFNDQHQSRVKMALKKGIKFKSNFF